MARPERDDLYGNLDPRDRRALYNPEVMRAELGITGDIYDEASSYVEDDLLSAIPVERSRAERAEAIAFARNEALNDYDPQSAVNQASDAADWARGPSRLSEVPTATSNPARPRTVAAGFDPATNTLTLVFRDGTFYNYYEVSRQEWNTFKELPSKWEYIRNSLDSHPRGEADPSSISAGVRQAIYQVARTAQVRARGKTNRSTMSSAIKQKNTPRQYPGGVNPNANKGRPKPPRPRARKK